MTSYCCCCCCCRCRAGSRLRNASAGVAARHRAVPSSQVGICTTPQSPVFIRGHVTSCCCSRRRTFAVQIEGSEVETIEGLRSTDGELTELQQALRQHHGLQCGFCTPGIVMSLNDLLEREADVTEQRIREVLSGHLCRCTGYHGIVQAALAVARGRSFGNDGV